MQYYTAVTKNITRPRMYVYACASVSLCEFGYEN